ncbi:MAG: GNAT family N-acetyltransferase [Hydrotalea sp.]|nr:GNAT family N-acetyltransferase [Hydrotalea sp.]
MLLFCNPWLANDLAALHGACFRGDDVWSANFLSQQLKNPAVLGLAAHDGGKILSFALLQMVGDVADVLTLATHPDHRARGYASHIVTALLGFLPQGGKLWLEVATDNHPALSLYQKMGFGEVAVRPNYYRAAQHDGRDIARAAKLLMFEKK